MAKLSGPSISSEQDGVVHHLRELWSAIRRRGVDRRLTRRVQVQIPLSVQAQCLGSDSICEVTRTISINAHGGLMSIPVPAQPVQPGQRLLVTNHGNEQTQEAVVVWARAKGPSNMKIGFRFSSAKPQFWANLEIGKHAHPGPRV